MFCLIYSRVLKIPQLFRSSATCRSKGHVAPSDHEEHPSVPEWVLGIILVSQLAIHLEWFSSQVALLPFSILVPDANICDWALYRWATLRLIVSQAGCSHRCVFSSYYDRPSIMGLKNQEKTPTRSLEMIQNSLRDVLPVSTSCSKENPG